jgi:hypothetical protein
MSVSSYVVSFVINDEIEPTTGVHKLLSLLFFSGSLSILRSINDAIGSYRKEKNWIIVCCSVYKGHSTWVDCSRTEIVVEDFLSRAQLRQQVSNWRLSHLVTMNRIIKIVNIDASNINVNSQSLTCVFIILFLFFLIKLSRIIKWCLDI